MNTSDRHRRLRPLLLILCAVSPFLFFQSALAQAPKDSSKSGSQTNLLDLFRAGDMVQAAADLRKAGESFERFGKSLEVLPTHQNC